MLSEDEARRLLQAAGDTIDVSPVAPPVDEPHRRWPALVAAAAVLAVLGGGAWLALPLPGGTSPDDPAPDGTTAVADGVPPGTVPSVFGHTQGSATDLLRSQGLTPELERQVSCVPEGRPVGTRPATGRPVGPGDTVTVLVAYQAANTDCAMDLSESWAFLDFANGHAPPPRFADEVTLVVDDARPVTLTGEEAADVRAWGAPSALTELRDATRQVAQVADEFRTPTLAAHEGTPPGRVCGVPRPALVGDREALTLVVDLPVEVAARCPATVAVYRTGGQIDTVVTWTGRSADEAVPPDPIPDVVGLGLEPARRAVTDAGYTALVEEQEACDPRPGVVEQAPTQQAVEEDAEDDPTPVVVVTLVVEVPHTTRDCAGLASAAAQFLRFARGGTAPQWAPEVDLLLGYERQTSIPAGMADDPDAWALCSGVDPARCRLSAVAVAGTGAVTTAASIADGLDLSGDVFPLDCLVDLGGLPLDLLPDNEIILRPSDPGSCLPWVVQLWIDDERRIEAVNLLVPESDVMTPD